MNKLAIALLTLSMICSSAFAQQWVPDPDNERELSAAQALLKVKQRDPSVAKWFDEAYAYAVFPKVGKGAIGIGGAHGKGIVIRGAETVGTASLSQITVGLQLGGQVYSEYILFEDQTSFNHFTRGQYEMGAQASAVAITLGKSADADYEKGVAVFTSTEGGLMFEASIGGQKFKYEAK